MWCYALKNKVSYVKLSKLVHLLWLCTLASFLPSKKLFHSQPSCMSPSNAELLLLIAVLTNAQSPTSLESKRFYAELGSTEWFSAPCRILFYEAYQKQLQLFPVLLLLSMNKFIASVAVTQWKSMENTGNLSGLQSLWNQTEEIAFEVFWLVSILSLIIQTCNIMA